MIKKILLYTLWVPLMLLSVVFLVANQQPVALSFDPFNTPDTALRSPALPLWAWLMLMLFVGVVLGSIGMWTSNAPNRRKMRALRAELKSTKDALAARNEAEPTGTNLPVLTAD